MVIIEPADINQGAFPDEPPCEVLTEGSGQDDCPHDEQLQLTEALRRMGMEPTQAWVISGTKTDRRRERNKRFRQKDAEQGIKQVSVRIPLALEEQFQHLATMARETGQLVLPESRTEQGQAICDQAQWDETRQCLALAEADRQAQSAMVATLRQELAQMKESLARQNARLDEQQDELDYALAQGTVFRWAFRFGYLSGAVALIYRLMSVS